MSVLCGNEPHGVVELISLFTPPWATRLRNFGASVLSAAALVASVGSTSLAICDCSICELTLWRAILLMAQLQPSHCANSATTSSSLSSPLLSAACGNTTRMGTRRRLWCTRCCKGSPWHLHSTEERTNTRHLQSLRTNLPTTVMQLPDLSFPDDTPSFPSHADVQKYLEEYASRFNVTPLVQLNSTVTRAEKIDGYWRLHVTSADRGEYEEDFDRLLIASGHGSKPQFVTVNGIEHFRGRVTHSRSYRTPDAYVDKVRSVSVVNYARMCSHLDDVLCSVCF